MLRRLMIGLFAVSMATIWVSEADALRSRRDRRSIFTTVFCSEAEGDPICQGLTFTDRITGVDGCEVTGTLVCEPVSPPEEGGAMFLSSSEETPAQVLVIDRDSIGKGSVYIKDGVPQLFSMGDVGWRNKGKGERAQLPLFATIAEMSESRDRIITLETGKVSDEGWFALTEIPDTWSNMNDGDPGNDLDDNEALHRYVGNPGSELIVDIGFGRGNPPQRYLHKIPGVQPIDAIGLTRLVDQTVCGVVHHNEIHINYENGEPLWGNLKGNYLGVVAFKVLSVGESSSLPQVEIEILDADEVCAGLLTYETAEIAQVEDIPFSTGDSLTEEITYTEDDCTDGDCEVGYPLSLSDTDGQAACDAQFGEGNTEFRKFYFDQFIGVIESPFETIVELCTEPGPGGVTYDCVPYVGEIPNCLLGPVVDMVFALDLTGSMAFVIDAVKDQIDDITTELTTVYDFTDFQFGVVSYEDYAGTFDSSSCGGIVSTYGIVECGDEPFRVDYPLTPDSAAIIAFVQNPAELPIRCGGDGPQSYGRVFWEAAQPDPPGSEIGWRADATKLLVNFGDDVPHDLDVNDGVPGAVGTWNTGVDPGRNEVVCDGDDIDFQDDALPAAINSGIKLVHINSGSEDLLDYWDYWTIPTGGGAAQFDPSGTSTILDLILEALGLEPPPE